MSNRSTWKWLDLGGLRGNKDSPFPVFKLVILFMGLQKSWLNCHVIFLDSA